MENQIEKIDKYIKNKLSEKRYNHSIKVMEKVEELAKLYNVDVEIAKMVGLAHDIAKEMTIDEINEYVKNNDMKISNEDFDIPVILHGIIGAQICKNEFNFTKDMQDAVYYHTVGRANMSMLEKILYVSDAIEDSRKYDEADELRSLAKINLDKTILIIVNYNIVKAIKENKPIHPNSIDLRNVILKEL